MYCIHSSIYSSGTDQNVFDGIPALLLLRRLAGHSFFQLPWETTPAPTPASTAPSPTTATTAAAATPNPMGPPVTRPGLAWLPKTPPVPPQLRHNPRQRPGRLPDQCLPGPPARPPACSWGPLHVRASAGSRGAAVAAAASWPGPCHLLGRWGLLLPSQLGRGACWLPPPPPPFPSRGAASNQVRPG